MSGFGIEGICSAEAGDGISMSADNTFCNKVTLYTNEVYFVMDALYLDDINANISVLHSNNFKERIKSELFPYADYPFLSIEITDAINPTVDLLANNIEAVDSDSKGSNLIISDTGVLIFVKENCLQKFLLYYSYDKLLSENHTSLFDLEYWSELKSKFNSYDLGMLSSGEDSGLMGSGKYLILTP